MLGGDAAPAHWRRRRGPRRPEKPSKMRSSCSGGTPGLRSATSATSVEPSSSARTVTSRPATWTRASSARVRDDPLQPPTVGAHREACGHPHRRLGEALHDHGVQQSDLRLRSEQPVPARYHREHQRAAAPILSRRTDLALYSRPTAPRWPLSSTAAPARLSDSYTIREAPRLLQPPVERRGSRRLDEFTVCRDYRREAFGYPRPSDSPDSGQWPVLDDGWRSGGGVVVRKRACSSV